jgi:hypothetical protein
MLRHLINRCDGLVNLVFIRSNCVIDFLIAPLNQQFIDFHQPSLHEMNVQLGIIGFVHRGRQS